MENSNYTMDDIAKFIADYKEDQNIKPNDCMVSIPLVGRKIYQKAALEQQKIDIFEKHFIKATNGNIEEQDEFIRQMTPVLDVFYSSKEKNKIGRR